MTAPAGQAPAPARHAQDRSPEERAHPRAGEDPPRPDPRKTPLILPAIVPPAGGAEGGECPVLAAARRAVEEAWADFLGGQASIYHLMRARRQLEVIAGRRGSPEAGRQEAGAGPGASV